MSALSKDLIERTHPVGTSAPTIKDMMENGIIEAAEDDSYYYVVSNVPGENVSFWIVEKTSGKTIRCAEYVVWLVCVLDQIPMMEPPYEFVIG